MCPDDGSVLIFVTSSDRIGQTIDGKFTIRSLLGKGGMGAVYLAHQHSMDRDVAVKLLHKSFSGDTVVVRRFLQEARGASKLNHPNIITLFDFGQAEDGGLYLMMELLEGRPLSELLKQTGPLLAGRAVGIVTQICDALHYAHQQGLVHRDLKPDNVFVIQKRKSDFAKVLDFGVAKMQTVDGGEALTKTGMVCGTPQYMSPEQAMGDEVDARSDVYSIGIILYELLAGIRPFNHDTPIKLLLSHINDEPPSFRETRPGLQVPAAVERVVMRTLAKHPEDRPQTAGELADELHAALADFVANPSTTELQHVDTTRGVPAPRTPVPETEDMFDLALGETGFAIPTPIGVSPLSPKVTGDALTGLAPAQRKPEPEPAATTDSIPTTDAPSSSPWRWLVALVALGVVGVGLWIMKAPADKPPADTLPDTVEQSASPRASTEVPAALPAAPQAEPSPAAVVEAVEAVEAVETVVTVEAAPEEPKAPAMARVDRPAEGESVTTRRQPMELAAALSPALPPKDTTVKVAKKPRPAKRVPKKPKKPDFGFEN